jgi:hypothetical protein
MKLAVKMGVATLPILLAIAPAASAARGTSGAGLDAIRPDASAIPGGEQAQSLLGGVMFYSLLIAAAALLASAALMGVGKLRRNPAHVEAGQSGALAAIGGAVLIGGCAAFISWAFNLGSSIH